MPDRDVLAKVAATQVLSGLYQAIADHAQIDAILHAMDDFLDSNPEGLEAGEADWKSMFREHFGRVGQFLDVDPPVEKDSPIVHVDKQVVPALVMNRHHEVIACNELFLKVTDGPVTSLRDAFSTPNDKRRVEQLARANGDAAPILISLTLQNTSGPVFVVATKNDLLEVTGRNGPFVTLKVARATWNPDLVPLLEEAYGLTPAEIEVLEGLVEGGSVSTVAIERDRSVRTVRTQLTHIFGKLGLTSQTELALFLATLTQLMTKEKRPSDIGKSWQSGSSDDIIHCKISIADRDVAYLKYGDPDGTPVLMLHSTTPPEMIPGFRQECRHAGLNMVAVHKPGSGGSSPRPAQDGPAELAADYAAILDAEGIDQAIIAGHCSAGLYALQFSEAYQRRSRAVLLIDTGVPFRNRRELMKLPKSLRRTFLPARYIPEVMVVPHRIFAANFQRSPAGEARVVDYFFQDCPVDQNLTRTDRTYFEITRQIIQYSFEDVDRLVADVCRWAKDWSHLLDARAERPTVFLHGDENRLFEADRIIERAEKTNGLSVQISKGCGQLQCYQTPALFTRVVSELATSNSPELSG